MQALGAMMQSGLQRLLSPQPAAATPALSTDDDSDGAAAAAPAARAKVRWRVPRVCFPAHAWH